MEQSRALFDTEVLVTHSFTLGDVAPLTGASCLFLNLETNRLTVVRVVTDTLSNLLVGERDLPGTVIVGSFRQPGSQELSNPLRYWETKGADSLVSGVVVTAQLFDHAQDNLDVILEEIEQAVAGNEIGLSGSIILAETS